MPTIDSNHKLAVLGNVTSVAQQKAIKFDGTGDYLTAPDHANWDLTTGDFTLELWVRYTTVQTDQNYIDVGSYTAGIMFQHNTAGSGMNVYIQNTDKGNFGSFTPIANRWYHMAACRASGTLRVFCDGVQQGGDVASSENIAVTQGVTIGARQAGTYTINALMRQVRISNSARYTAAFTPPTTNFVSDANTLLLIAAEDSLHAVTFADTGNTGHTITTNGNCVLELAPHVSEGVILDTSAGAKVVTKYGDIKQVPYMLNKSAGFFAGTGSASGSEPMIVVPDSADWDFGTGDFTIETFINLRSFGTNAMPFSRNDGSSPDGFEGVITSSAIQFQIFGSVLSGSYAFQTNRWYHCAWVRYSGNRYIYVNGKQVATSANTSNISGSSQLNIGANGSFNWGIDGWMKEYRISNSARYTADFTPTTVQFTSDSNTKLLLHFDTPATSPLCPAIKFDGSGDYLTVADHADWDLSTTDYCLEAFVRWNSIGTSTVIEVGNAGAVGVKVTYSANTLQHIVSGSAISSPSWTPVVNRWYHIAATRASGTAYLFADGVLLHSVANSSNLDGSTVGVRVGSDQSAQAINGWMREVRVSNASRYTAAFTPSQTGFTVDSNTKLYIKGNEANGVTTFVDSSTTPKTVTTVGNSVINYVEDYRNTIFTDSGNTGHKIYGWPGFKAKVDFVSLGESALTFDGSLDHLTLPDSADWNYNGGTGNFTLEAWIRPRSFAQYFEIFSHGTDGSTYGSLVIVAAADIRFFADNTVFAYAGPLNGTSHTFVADVWAHVLLVRGWGGNANDYAITVNGIAVATGTDASTYPNYTSELGIGCLQYAPGTELGAGYYAYGLMDNILISNTARYTATFDPPYDAASSGGLFFGCDW